MNQPLQSAVLFKAREEKLKSWALMEFCLLLIQQRRRVRWTWSPYMWLVNHSIEILQMEQSHRCYKVILSLPAEPSSTVEPRIIWESHYNKRSSSLKYATCITLVHHCVEASGQENFHLFAVILVFSLGLRSSKYVIMWQYGWGKLSPVWEGKWNGGRKILTSAQPPQRRPDHKLECCDIRRRSWNSQVDGCWAPQKSEEASSAVFIHFDLFGFSTFCSSHDGGTFPKSTNVLPDLCTFLPNLLHFENGGVQSIFSRGPADSISTGSSSNRIARKHSAKPLGSPLN